MNYSKVYLFLLFSLILMLVPDPAQATTTRKVLVFLADYNDRPARSCTVAKLQKNFFDRSAGASSVSNLYFSSSKAQLDVTGDVVRVNLGADPQSCGFSTLKNLTAQAASQVNGRTINGTVINSSNYSDFILVNSPASCSSNWGSRGNVWLFDDCDNYWALPVMAHEFGHSLGLYHAGWVRPQGDTNDRFQDSFSLMGSNVFTLLPLNAPQMDSLGWLSAQDIKLINTPGTHTIDISPVDRGFSDGLPQVIKIPKSGGGFYYLSFRSRHGFGLNLNSNGGGGDLPKNYALQYLSVHRHSGTDTQLLALLTLSGTTPNDPSQGVRSSFDSATEGIHVQLDRLILDQSARVTVTYNSTTPPPSGGGTGGGTIYEAPSAKIISPASGTVVTGKTVTIRFSTSNSVVKTMISAGGGIRGTVMGAGTFDFNVSVGSYGKKFISLKAYDKQGRFTESAKIQVQFVR